MVKMLPIVKVEEEGDKLFFFDERLRQLRAVNNPHDYINLNDFELEYYKEQIKSRSDENGID